MSEHLKDPKYTLVPTGLKTSAVEIRFSQERFCSSPNLLYCIEKSN